MVELEVWGDYGLFTIPYFTVEKLSYPIMTPGAARGIFQSIYWKPRFQYMIKEIQILSEIKYTSFRKNEIKEFSQTGCTYYESKRTQRNSTCLVKPHYIIKASLRLFGDKLGENDTVKTFEEQFKRRASRGAFFRSPFLGQKEFVANFRIPDEDSPPPIKYSKNLGDMVFDVFDLEEPGSKIRPVFFKASIENGVMKVPNYFYLLNSEEK